MSLPVVDLSSDSDSSSYDNEDNNVNNNSRINVNQTDSSHKQRSDPQNVQAKSVFNINQPEVIKDPLIKIIFRDELTSRKYRQRIEDIIKYVMITQEDVDNQNRSNLVLDIYDPALEKASTPQNQQTPHLTQAAQEAPINNFSYHKQQELHSHSPNTRKKLKHRRESQSSEQSTTQIQSTNSLMQEVPVTSANSTICIKQEFPENAVSSNSKKKSKHKPELQNSNEPTIQTQPAPPTPQTQPAPPLMQGVAETNLNNTIHIKQESQDNTDSPNSKEKSITKHQVQDSREPTLHTQSLTQNLPTPPATQEVPETPANITTDIKPELQDNTSNSRKKSKRKQESQDVDDSSYCDKKSKKCNEEINEEFPIDIYKEILDDDDCSQLTHLETCFENNSVRIGSYGYFNQDKSIFISKDGLTFFVPTFKKGKQLKIISIELHEILRILVNFSKTKPALFFFVTTKTGIQIRELLSMDDPSGPYFDPNSLDLKHQRIAILPAEISDESESIIRELFKNKEMVEIDAQVTDDLINVVPATEKPQTQRQPNKPYDAYETFKQSLIAHNNSKSKLTNNNDKSVRESVANVTSPNIKAVSNHGITYFCRIIRVGSLEYAKKRVFLISKKGIKFCVPNLNNASLIVTLDIEIDEIAKVAIHFSRNMPMLFFHISLKAAQRIRKLIGMTDPSGPYIDPAGDAKHNKIIILPQTISEGCFALKEWFIRGKIEKLDKYAAKDMLAKSFSNYREKHTEPPPNLLQKHDETMLNRTNLSDNKDTIVQYTTKTVEKNHDTEQSKTDLSENNVETTEIVTHNCLCIRADCVRIGTFRFKDEKTNFTISSDGLNFIFPEIHDAKKFNNIVVRSHEITEVSYFFSINTSFLFIHTTVPCAQKIRSLIGMHDHSKGSDYFDPNSESLEQRRLVIIYKQSNYKYRSIFKHIWHYLPLNKIPDYKTARKMWKSKL